ncbi:minor tail protein [Paucimonas lemoignei]|uniref:Minor tail protein n=1 Tax=Paucimonas lemoignei TaxID=29443 RepID=A0A4R3HWM9_PAULE|nr:phage tail tape measure protein [Paucimonas lemoignei]TCS35799.1 minor tail protein [Paucimonas lemoignei]
MSNDITVRIRADYGDALKAVQAFTGAAGKSMGELPKAVKQSGDAVVRLTYQLGGTKNNLSELPPLVRQLSTSVDTLSTRIDQLGRVDGPDRLKRRLRDSNEEASRLSQTMDKLVKGGKALGAAFAGFQAGKMVFQQPMERMLDYDQRLAQLANTAMADKSVQERRAAIPGLNSIIMGATRFGGGTRDEALTAYQNILASGTVKDAEAKAMLPTVMHGATASGALPKEISDIGIRAMQNFGFKAQDLPTVIDMAIKSGNMGGFELKDMAKMLPAQMAAASTLGMKGEKGLALLLAANQASATTAGNMSEAGNNVLNLLNKINSSDTQQDFKKLGIDLTGSLQAATAKGVDPITAFAGLVNRVMSKDKNYVALEKRRQSATSSEDQQSIIEQQLQLAQGTAIGKVLQDQQARLAYIGVMSQQKNFNTQVAATMNGGASGTTAGNFAVMSATAGFNRQQSINEQMNSQHQALQKLVPALNSYWEHTAKLNREYPVLGQAIEGGKVGIATLGAGAGAASIVMTLLTKNAAAASTALGGVAAAGGAADIGGKNIGRAAKYGRWMGAAGTVAGSLAPVAVPAVAALGFHQWQQSDAGQQSRARGLSLENEALQRRINMAKANGDTDLQTKLERQLARQQATVDSIRGPAAKADPSAEKVSQAIQQSVKFNPIEAKLQLQVAFDSFGQPIVSQTKLTSQNMRLDTGPTLTH